MSTLISGFRHRAVLSGMLLVMICSISLLRGQGQGSVSFSSVGAPDAKKIYVGTVTGGVLASGSAYAVAWYWAPEGTCDESQFTQIGGSATFLTGASAGTFFGGGRTITTPGSPVNGPTLNFQVRAWNTSSGNNYEAVRNSGDPEAKIGKSPIF